MPSKVFTLDGAMTVTVYKRKANRSLRLTIGHGGEVRVSIPAWAPYRAGVSFAASRLDWIRAQRPMAQLLSDAQAVGKAHHLSFSPKDTVTKVTTRVGSTSVLVSYPAGLSFDDPVVQKAAREACIRALRQQAEQLLPQRLRQLAATHDFRYSSVAVKRLKGRWGSCDQRGHIVLNLFLMQLPWELIDYVLLHELTHTVVLRHGPDFWKGLAGVLPDFDRHKKTIRGYQPVLIGMT